MGASPNAEFWFHKPPIWCIFNFQWVKVHIWIALFVFSSEKDVNGDTLWVWCYPSVSSDLRQVLLRKCCLTQDSRNFHTFVFGQFCRTWYYITTVEVQEPTALNKVQCSSSDLWPRVQRESVARTKCHIYLFNGCLSFSPSRSLIFQWLLQQKTLTQRSMQHLTEYSAGTVSVTLFPSFSFNRSSSK